MTVCRGYYETLAHIYACGVHYAVSKTKIMGRYTMLDSKRKQSFIHSNCYASSSVFDAGRQGRDNQPLSNDDLGVVGQPIGLQDCLRRRLIAQGDITQVLTALDDVDSDS